MSIPNKLKNKKYQTVPKSSIKIIKKGKIDIPQYKYTLTYQNLKVVVVQLMCQDNVIKRRYLIWHPRRVSGILFIR